MNKLLVSIAAVAILAVPSITMASDIYVAGQVNHSNIEVSAGTDTFKLNDTTGGGVGVGYNVNNWLAVEGTYENLGRGTFNVDVGHIHYKIRTAGVWAVADPTLFSVSSMPVKVLARVGYTYSWDGGDLSSYDTTIAYGIGAAVGVTKNIDVTFEYRPRHVVDNGADLDLKTYLVGATYSF